MRVKVNLNAYKLTALTLQIRPRGQLHATVSQHRLFTHLSTGTSKNPWICDACKSIVCSQADRGQVRLARLPAHSNSTVRTITWSHPLLCNMFATSLAVIGARLLSFLSCRAYGNKGNTAVMRFALAILQAWIMMHSSMSDLFTSPYPVLTMYTSFSRTDSEMRTDVSPIPLHVISALETGRPSLCEQWLYAGVPWLRS